VYSKSQTRWSKISEAGATDKDIIEELNYNMGLGGGSGGPGWLHEEHRGNPPRIWFDFNMGQPDITGKQLIDITRVILDIGMPGCKQLHLF